ncbi:MAG: transcription-repair coupling factor [Candidatus Sericytochromatia bacterium]|nr:transcription-repair coupling factor [Candidatus Sericytochromatia bacterium]
MGALEPLWPYLASTQARADLDHRRHAVLHGMSLGAGLLLAATLDPPWVLIVPDADTLREALLDLPAHGCTAMAWPGGELSLYHGVSPESENTLKRHAVLAALEDGTIDGVVTTASALAHRLPAKDVLREATLRLTVGDIVAPADLASHLVRMGFHPESSVTTRGTFARRGGLLDIWPPGTEQPVRLEWFGENIESMRPFEPVSQRSEGQIEHLTVWPVGEMLLPTEAWPETAEIIRRAAAEQSAQLRGWGHRHEADRLKALVQDHLERLGSFRPGDGDEIYASFCHGVGTLLEHLPDTTTLLRWLPAEGQDRLGAYLEGEEAERDRKRRAGLLIQPPVEPLASLDEVEESLAKFRRVDLSPEEPEDDLFWWAPQVQGFPNRYDELARRLLARSRSGERVVIASNQPQRVFALLEEHGCHSTYGARLPGPGGAAYGGVWIFRESLGSGFEWPELRLAVYSDREIFGWRKTGGGKSRSRPKQAGTPITSLEQLRPGDLVVHAKHGIGRFQGLHRIVMDGTAKEFLLVLYQGDDRLYVPVEQTGQLHRYRSAGDGSPRLSKMGGTEWENVKNRVRKAVQAVAEDLLQIHARRAALPGHPFGPDSAWQQELEDGFPYTETVDQLRAIEETKADMEAARPMDRLICGDVGFGKTEVAIRAAFKAAVGGKQVAVLAPTTLLAHQHYQVFRERFAPYPVRVAPLSRFRTAAQQKETLRQLGLGEVDVVVGTHRLLSKDVQFRDLGLLIVDEEHRFGVSHKERLKAIKTQVDVLSMSATPIPRTLYLALSGARDMSLITTPPANRLPVKTMAGPWDPEEVRKALLRELDRGGQVFVLQNRIEELDRIAAMLVELVPGARVRTAHGQMPENELEEIMLSFVAHEFDVLIATTIIESGLDIPRANTILILDADRLGLAQLYQLRGRVGRSDTKAYCYLFHAEHKQLTDEGRDRLVAMVQHTALGSGYQIALRDMEIRGVGNILGAEQHGQMLTVGYDTYMQLLEEAIAEGLGDPLTPRSEAVVDLQVAAMLPDDWFEDPDDKMLQYRRLAQVGSLRELELLTEEWKDRFGPPTPTVRNLLRLVGLKLRATDLRIPAIKAEKGKVKVAISVPRPIWSDIQMQVPALAHWQWAAEELILDRKGMVPDEHLVACERLLEALTRPALVLD